MGRGEVIVSFESLDVPRATHRRTGKPREFRPTRCTWAGPDTGWYRCHNNTRSGESACSKHLELALAERSDLQFWPRWIDMNLLREAI